MDPRSSDETLQRDIRSFIECRPPLVQHPFMRPRPEEGIKIKLMEKFGEDTIDIEEPELVQVYLRMKPCKVPNNLYELRSDKCLVTSLDTTTAGHGRRTQHNVSKMYTFSKIFKPESSQTEIFEQVVKQNLKRLVDGHSFTLLTYGASGSGKTYTVMGTVNSPGLIPRALEYIFLLVDAAQTPIYKPSENGTDMLSRVQQVSESQWVKRQISASFREKYRRMSSQLHRDLTVSSVDLTNRTKYYVWVSFVEIYNEAIYDLLAPPDRRDKLRLRDDSSGNVYVKGVTQVFVRSGEEAYDVMVAGKHNLVVAATGIHAHSSRSHCIFTITMLTEKDGEIRTSHVRFCDLAGCERQRSARNTGARMLESRAINSSLHVLERCLHMLRRKQLFTKDSCIVPYRESKLTRLLGSGLSGARGEAVTMLVTLNPAPQYAHESRHVLSLAVVAKDIQINNTIDPAPDPAVTMSSLECTQDSTAQDYNDEIMRLRAENERLHFELVQAESYNRQLQRNMEEKQEESATTMKGLIEETKDMMRQYYEKQLAILRNQMKEMEQDYETTIADMAEENKLYKEMLALNKTESHLRERDEGTCENDYEDRESPNQDPTNSTNSEDESESDTDLDESLEPVNAIRKSILGNPQNKGLLASSIRESLYKILTPTKNETVIDLINESSEDQAENEESENDTINNDGVKSQPVPESDSMVQDSVDISKDSVYATGDDDTADTNADKDKSECEEIFNVSTKLNETQDVREINVIPTNPRGTYFVESESQEKCNVDQGLNTLNTFRGTYFIADRETSFYKETNIEIDNEKNKVSIVKDKEPSTKNKECSTEFVKPATVANTLVSKIVKSLKDRQSSKSSLRQLRHLEFADSNIDNTTDAVKSFEISIPRHIMKNKGYFDDTPKEISDTIDATDIPTEKPNDGNGDVKKSKYIEDKTAENDLCKLSSATKSQKNRLMIDSRQTSLDSLEKQDKSDNMQSLILTPKIVKEAQLYFTENDKVKHNDVLISKSPSITRYESTEECEPVIHNDVLISESQSIVKDDIPQEYVPSIAVRKILGESFTKPEIHTTRSTRKDKKHETHTSKKHESFDIFESPLLNCTKASSKEIKTIEMTANRDADKSKDDIKIEIPLVTHLKEKTATIAHEFIESLVASQKIKEYIKREKLSSETSDAPESAIDNINTEVIKQEELTLERVSFTSPVKTDHKESEVNANVADKLHQPLNDAETSKGNNTVDEFENIVKNLTNPRATEFELLVAEEELTAPAIMKPTQEIDTTKENEKREENERRIKFEEAKYNLRNKKTSNLNLSDDKKEIETEQEAESTKARSTTKRCLRLRRRKNVEEDNHDRDNGDKLKNLINLTKEFSDVTMGLPVAKKDVKDIPSPEKLPGEEENVPPVMGIQSCPSKSVTRSRRKLFTPRAEPLEESPSQTGAGASNERLYVPRPSYHRARARRKL